MTLAWLSAWATANPFASLFLILVAILAALWFVSWVSGDIETDHCDHSECERPQVGDVTIRVFESKRQDAGDGVESGV